MTEITKILLKNGIKEMINENEEYFKQNITHSLSLKLNSCISETKKEIQKNIFTEEFTTEPTQEIKYFVSFLEAFKPGKFTFKDGSSINISEEDLNHVTKLFEKLNPEKRQILVKDLFESAYTFESNLNFAQKVKGLVYEK